MTPEQLLERLAAVRIDRSHGTRAPHKPLLLLLALGRTALGPEGRLIPYAAAERRFRELWREFGRPGTQTRVVYPFGRLRNDDDLWEIPEESLLSTGRGADILVSEARRFKITGGYTPRGSRFRKDVLDAYDERCAVCEHDIRFGDRLLGLEAAHIRWHSHDGRDVVPNGLALCSVHHKALDCGALGLESKRSGFEILISGRVRGRSNSAKRLLGFMNKPIRPPRSPSDAPRPQFVEWHRQEVFRP